MPHPPPALYDTLYASQIYDAVQSAHNLRKGQVETTFIMRPFSHGGVPTMLLGFIVQDVALDVLLRNASVGQHNTELGLRTAVELASIVDNNKHRVVGGKGPVLRALNLLTDAAEAVPIIELRFKVGP